MRNPSNPHITTKENHNNSDEPKYQPIPLFIEYWFYPLLMLFTEDNDLQPLNAFLPIVVNDVQPDRLTEVNEVSFSTKYVPILIKLTQLLKSILSNNGHCFAKALFNNACVVVPLQSSTVLNADKFDALIVFKN